GARAANSAAMELVGVGGIAVTLAWAVVRIEAGAMRPDAFVSFFAALLMLYEPLKGLGRVNAWMQAGVSGLERVGLLMALESEKGGQGQVVVGPVRRVVLEEVSFVYPGSDRPAVDGLSLALEAREVVQLAGPSGVGKSTVVRLMLGLLTPTTGQVRINGHLLETLDRDRLRGELAYAGQTVLLFAGSVRDNIRLGRPDADDEAVGEAAWLAAADRFIEALPEGYDTWLHEGGRGLSGGQRQRVALARALLKPASVLILDEALTGIERPLREEVLARIRQRRPNLVVVVITHGLVETASRVVELALPTDRVT
ncbi:MAG: ABC transporter ATP-binding protein, partial [Myxococcota bacterium]